MVRYSAKKVIIKRLLIPNFRALHSDANFLWNVSFDGDTGNEGGGKGYKMAALQNDTA